jgi:hypothetical protein
VNADAPVASPEISKSIVGTGLPLFVPKKLPVHSDLHAITFWVGDTFDVHCKINCTHDSAPFDGASLRQIRSDATFGSPGITASLVLQFSRKILFSLLAEEVRRTERIQGFPYARSVIGFRHQTGGCHFGRFLAAKIEESNSPMEQCRL